MSELTVREEPATSITTIDMALPQVHDVGPILQLETDDQEKTGKVRYTTHATRSEAKPSPKCGPA